jgi:hypothetical protein
MRIKKHVSLVWDLTLHMDFMPALAGIHDHLFLPSGTKHPIGASVEVPAPMMWPPGFLLGNNQFTTTVYHHHVWIVLDGHDLGPMLGHMCIPPVLPTPVPPFIDTCVKVIVDVLLSSRKAYFSAGEVKANDKPIACCTMFVDFLAPPTPMATCGIVPAPTVGSATSLMTDLLVGMTWVDFFAGCAALVVDIIAGLIWHKASGGFEGGTPAPGDAPSFGDAVGEEGSSGVAGGAATGGWGDGAAGIVRWLGQEYAGYRGDAGGSVGPVSVTRDGDTMDTTVEASNPELGNDRTVFHNDGTVERNPPAEPAEGPVPDRFTNSPLSEGSLDWL